MLNLKSISIKTGLILASCAVTYLAFEGVLRIITLRKNIYTIEMVKYAKTLKMKDPKGIISHVHRPNSQAQLMGVNIKLNSLGHRSAERDINSTAKKVFVLGSSITMGWGVSENDVFSSVVERTLNQEGQGVELLNAGIGNYNTAFQYELFKRQVDLIKPDAVVLHYFINDAEPNPKSSNPFAKYSYLAAYLNSEFQSLWFRYMGGKDLAAYYKSLYVEDNPQWKKTLTQIENMRQMSLDRNSSFLVMIVPDTHNLEENSPYKEIYAKIEDAFEKKSISTLNLFSDFQQRFGANEPALWVQHDDPHPNALGHALMAEKLSDYLSKSLNDKKIPKHTS